MKYLIERLQEASTWRGFVLLATALGANWSPESQTAIITTGLAVAGAVGAFVPDTKK